MSLTRALAIVTVVAGAISACAGSPTRVVTASSTNRCARACAAAEHDERERTVCHACRCKDALGELPPQSAVTCEAGAVIPIERIVDGRRVDTTGPVETCANPALLDLMPHEQACSPGSRLGQVVTDSAIFRFICRRTPDGTAYDDMGVIGHNPKTGATCFWTSIDEKRTDGVIPALDVTDGDPAKLDAMERAMQLGYEGDKCISCHDNDPYVYSPHLAKVWRWDVDSYRLGPYAQVRLAGPATPIPHRHLTSEAAAPCTTCHRIADGRTCETFVPSSAGILAAGLPYQPELRSSRALARWMPHPAEAWSPAHDAAVAHIARCCQSPDDPWCRWAPIPNAPK